jgi:hypothetical protein
VAETVPDQMLTPESSASIRFQGKPCRGGGGGREYGSPTAEDLFHDRQCHNGRQPEQVADDEADWHSLIFGP